jgi:hypothetical protein
MSFGVRSVAKNPVLSIDLNTKHGINNGLVSEEFDTYLEFVMGSEATLYSRGIVA